MPIGDPVAVTLLEWTSYHALKTASLSGDFQLRDGNRVYANQVFRTLGLNGPLGTEWLAMIIVNGLPSPLTLVGSWLDQSRQTHYPVESNLVGSWDEPRTGESSPGQNGEFLPGKENTIPGSRPHPTKPGSTLYGSGAYGFDVSVSNYGAIALSYGQNTPSLGISWSIGYPSNSGVTADTSAYHSVGTLTSLEVFYNQTAGAKTVGQDDGADVSIRAGLGAYGLDDLEKDGQVYRESYALIVAVWPKGQL